MISTKLAQDTVDIRSIMLENQDLEIVSKPPDGINGQEKLNNNRKEKKNKAKQNKTKT